MISNPHFVPAGNREKNQVPYWDADYLSHLEMSALI